MSSPWGVVDGDDLAERVEDADVEVDLVASFSDDPGGVEAEDARLSIRWDAEAG